MKRIFMLAHRKLEDKKLEKEKNKRKTRTQRGGIVDTWIVACNPDAINRFKRRVQPSEKEKVIGFNEMIEVMETEMDEGYWIVMYQKDKNNYHHDYGQYRLAHDYDLNDIRPHNENAIVIE